MSNDVIQFLWFYNWYNRLFMDCFVLGGEETKHAIEVVMNGEKKLKT